MVHKIEKKGVTQWFETIFYRKFLFEVLIYKNETFLFQLDASVVPVLMGLIAHWRKLLRCPVRRLKGISRQIVSEG